MKNGVKKNGVVSSSKRNDLHKKKFLVTGGSGFLGNYVVEKLVGRGVSEGNILVPRSRDFDLRKIDACQNLVKNIDIVIHLAGNVGGIGYNQKNPATLFYDNLVMGVHLMEAARTASVSKFVSIATICSYPKFTPVPFKEEELWNGYPEETNAPYGLAKKMLLVQGQAYRQQYGFNAITIFPTNLYGPGDNFTLEDSHVIPALIRKFVEARNSGFSQVVVWGTGKPTREFLYVEDAAEGIILATQKYDKPEPVNLGSGFEISTGELAKLIADWVGFKGKIVFDTSRPDGQPKRRIDSTRALKEFGFRARTDFDQGIKKTAEWYDKIITWYETKFLSRAPQP